MALYCINKHTKECSGCMECQPEPDFYCPVCGKETYEAVFVSGGEVIGCDNCVEIKEPHEVLKDETNE